MKHIIFPLALALPAMALADDSFSGGEYTVEQLSGNVLVSGRTDLHVTGAQPLADGAAIDLADDDSWLYLHAVRPSQVRSGMLGSITIAGAPAVSEGNVRLALWGSGTLVIPNGPAHDACALTVYDKPGCQGEELPLEITAYHNKLGRWDNRIQSFRLRRGYMATFANNANGSGHSRCFIADKEDIVVDVMPEGFVTYMGEDGSFDPDNTESFVSFVRVFRWEWPGKKGWAGWNSTDIAGANVDSYYSWSADKKADDPANGFYAIDHEFVPIKQQRWWPGWDQINGLSGVSHLLGYNEPDQSGQADVDFTIAVELWPEMFTSGLRIGSPAPAGAGSTWLTNFFHYINLCNYRCDFAVAHIYEYIDANGWQDRINTMVKHSGGRPCWITEYNNGANWTNEPWPSGNRSATDDNLEHQRQWAESIIPAMDTIAKLERAHFYNWVEDCRAFELNGRWTPAGQLFAQHLSVPGYSSEQAYDHIWRIAPPYVIAQADALHENVTLRFYDHNGETGTGYEFYRLDEGGYVLVGSVSLGTDYKPGDKVTYTMPIPQDRAGTIYYKVQAVSYRGERSLMSDAISVKGAVLPAPSVRKREALGEAIVLEWDPIVGAESYRVKRGTDKNTLHTIEYEVNATEYTDATTKPETVYYYQVGAQSKWSETSWSATMRIYSGASSLDLPSADDDSESYYTLQGIKVDNPSAGIYIMVQGGKARKVILE